MQASNPSVSLHERALLGSAGDADRAAAGDLGELPDDLAHRAGGGRHHHRLARPWAGRHRRGRSRPSCPACRARRWRWRSAPSTRSTLRMAGPGPMAYSCQPSRSSTMSPTLKSGMVGFHHLADGAAGHRPRRCRPAPRRRRRRACARACRDRATCRPRAPAPRAGRAPAPAPPRRGNRLRPARRAGGGQERRGDGSWGSCGRSPAA